MEVMLIPQSSDKNKYLKSLRDGLESQGVDIMEYSWCTEFPLLGPMISQGRPDVVHIHWLDSVILGPSWPRTVVKGVRLIFEMLVLKILGVSIIWTVHNLSSHDQRYPRWEQFYRTVLPNLFFDRLIVHCNRAEALVREEYSIRSSLSVSVIPHGHYIDRYSEPPSQEDARRSLDVGSDFLFLFFGRIREYKQVPELIRAFKQLDSSQSTLIIAGNPASERLKRTLLTHTEDNDDIETRLEFISDSEVSTYFAAADTVVLPYRDILTSGSAILAMSYSCPVVVPRLGCMPNLIENEVDGFLYNPETAGSLKQAMETALGADCRKMGQNARRNVREFSWLSIAEQTRELYEY